MHLLTEDELVFELVRNAPTVGRWTLVCNRLLVALQRMDVCECVGQQDCFTLEFGNIANVAPDVAYDVAASLRCSANVQQPLYKRKSLCIFGVWPSVLHAYRVRRNEVQQLVKVIMPDLAQRCRRRPLVIGLAIFPSSLGMTTWRRRTHVATRYVYAH